MYVALGVLQIFIVLLLIFFIMVQKPDSDGLSGLSGNMNMNAVFTPAGSANFFSKATFVLITIFMLNSLVISKVYMSSKSKNSIINELVEDNTTNSQTTDQDSTPFIDE